MNQIKIFCIKIEDYKEVWPWNARKKVVFYAGDWYLKLRFSNCKIDKG